MAMQVILTEDVYKLGDAGDVVKVKNGYARNYLIPRGMAMLATEGRVKEIEHKKRVIDEKQKRLVGELQGRAKELGKATLAFERQASDEGKLFGSVTNMDIAAQLAEQGYELDRRKIQLAEPIKSTGTHEISVRLHREVVVPLQVTVTGVGLPEAEAEAEEADEAEDFGATEATAAGDDEAEDGSSEEA